MGRDYSFLSQMSISGIEVLTCWVRYNENDDITQYLLDCYYLSTIWNTDLHVLWLNWYDKLTNMFEVQEMAKTVSCRQTLLLI